MVVSQVLYVRGVLKEQYTTASKNYIDGQNVDREYTKRASSKNSVDIRVLEIWESVHTNCVMPQKLLHSGLLGVRKPYGPPQLILSG